MEKNVISFSVENWVTVLIMAVVGFAVLGFAVRLAYKVKGKDNG